MTVQDKGTRRYHVPSKVTQPNGHYFRPTQNKETAKVPEKAMVTHSSTLAWRIPWTEEPGRLRSIGSQKVRHDSNFTFSFHFHSLEKEMATHSSVLAWRIPGMGEPGGLPSMGSHRVRHDWSDLAAAAAAAKVPHNRHFYGPALKVPSITTTFICFSIISPDQIWLK